MDRAVDLPVRWRDLDPLGHVHHSVFLHYLEEGRNVWLRSVLGEGFSPDQYVLARIELDYLGEIRLDHGRVTASCGLQRIGNSSLTTWEELRDPDGATLATANAVLVLWDPEQRRKRRLTDSERRRLEVARA